MYIIKDNIFINTKNEKYDINTINEILFKDKYDYAIFSELDRDFGYIKFLDSNKVRILYKNENSNRLIMSGNIISILQRPSINSINFIKNTKDEFIYLSRFGFCRNSMKEWINDCSEEELIYYMNQIKNIIVNNNVLFYGCLHCGRLEIIDGIINSKIINIKHVNIYISKEKLINFLLENKCFASIGLDGGSIGCWRDWEVSLSMVPSLRNTQRADTVPYSNPCCNQYVFIDINDLEYQINKIKEDIISNKILENMIKIRNLSKFIINNIEFSEAMDSLSCDFDFFKENILKENSIDIFKEKAKEKKINNANDYLFKENLKNNKCFNNYQLQFNNNEIVSEEYFIIGEWKNKNDIYIFNKDKTFIKNNILNGIWTVYNTLNGKFLLLNENKKIIKIKYINNYLFKFNDNSELIKKGNSIEYSDTIIKNNNCLYTYKLEDGLFITNEKTIIKNNNNCFYIKRKEIPKIMHFFYKTNKDWINFHKDWEIIEWDIKKLIEKYGIVHSKNNYSKYIYKLKCIYEYGGIAIDENIKCLQNIEYIIKNCIAFTVKRNGSCTTNIFGSIQQHEWIQEQFDLLPFFINRDQSCEDRIITEATNKLNEVRVYEQSLFYPKNNNDTWTSNWQNSFCQ